MSYQEKKKFDINDYVSVNERIEAFYKKYPDGSIQTDIVNNADGKIIFKAYAYRTAEDIRPSTGHAMEVEGTTYINKTSHVENCETSAVGRALAMMGFELKKSVASKEEVVNAKQQQKKETETITLDEAKKLVEMIGTNKDLGNLIIGKKYKYKKLEDIKTTDYNNICAEIKKEIETRERKNVS
jgi:hypothetical protein